MAKARDIAALAGLAGMAYAMRNKDKGTTDSNPTRAARPESTETREDKVADEGYKNDVLKTITQKREGPNDQAGNQGVLGGDKPKSGSKPISKSKPELQLFTTRKDPREAESGMSRGTRTPAKPASTTSSSEEGMKNYKPRSTPASPAKDTAVSAVKEAAKTVAKTAAQSPAGAIATAAKPLADKAVAASGYKVPTSEEAAANRQAVYDKVKGVGSSVVDYVKNFETPAERAARERKAAAPFKRGGAVKKMASGGMTASRRADGIATRGKTKCKMY